MRSMNTSIQPRTGISTFTLAALGVSTVLAVGAVVPSAAAAAPEAPAYLFDETALGAHPKNLARRHMGASVVETRGIPTAEGTDRSPAVLLSEELETGFQLPQGTGELVIALGQTEALEGLRFANGGAGGQVTVRTSETLRPIDGDGWSAGRPTRFQPADRVVSVDIGWEDAKYLHVRFDTAKAGRIGCFGVYSERASHSFELAPLVNVPDGSGAVVAGDGAAPVTNTAADINVASIYAGARVVYTSGGKGNPNAMLDQDAATAFTLDPDSPQPVVVLELGHDYDISRLSLMVDEGDAGVRAYLLDHYAGGAPDLSGLAPDSAFPVVNGSGAGNLGAPASGRFVVLAIDHLDSPILEIGAHLTDSKAVLYGVIPGISADPSADPSVAVGLLQDPSAFRFGPLGFAGSNFLRRGGFGGTPPGFADGRAPRPSPTAKERANRRSRVSSPPASQ